MSAIDDILYSPIHPEPEPAPQKEVGVVVGDDGFIHITWVPVTTTSGTWTNQGTIVVNTDTSVSTGTVTP